MKQLPKTSSENFGSLRARRSNQGAASFAEASSGGIPLVTVIVAVVQNTKQMIAETRTPHAKPTFTNRYSRRMGYTVPPVGQYQLLKPLATIPGPTYSGTNHRNAQRGRAVLAEVRRY